MLDLPMIPAAACLYTRVCCVELLRQPSANLSEPSDKAANWTPTRRSTFMGDLMRAECRVCPVYSGTLFPQQDVFLR